MRRSARRGPAPRRTSSAARQATAARRECPSAEAARAGCRAAGGGPGKCGTTVVCQPESCASQNIACGPAGDGCGNVLQCGSCATGDIPASTRPGSAGRRRSELDAWPHAAVGGMSGARRPRTRQTGCPSSPRRSPRDGAHAGRDTAEAPPRGGAVPTRQARPPPRPASASSDGGAPPIAPHRPGRPRPLAGRAAAPARWRHAKGEPRRGVSSRRTRGSTVVPRER